MIELTQEEKDFLTNLLTNVVPALSVPAKDAPGLLKMSEEITNKLKAE